MAVTPDQMNDPDLRLAGSDPELVVLFAATLSAAYQYSSVLNVSYANSILLLFNYVHGTNTACNLKFQFAADDANTWYDLCQYDQGGAVGLWELDLGNADVDRCMYIPNPGAQNMRVGVKGTAANGSLGLYALRGRAALNMPRLVT